MNLYQTVSNRKVETLRFFKSKILDQTQKKQEVNLGSCHHIVSFFLKLSNTKKSELTQKISKAIISLDRLARVVDYKIDNLYSESFDEVENLSTKKIDGLKDKIENCIEPLKNEEGYTILLKETFDAIEHSLELNTTKRHLIYNLDSKIKDKESTIHYLFPLISFLNKKSEKVEIESSFISIGTYIQILDDYVDLLEDISNFTKTPISDRYWELGNSSFFFKTLSLEVFAKLKSVFELTYKELFYIYGERQTNSSLKNWIFFQARLDVLVIPEISNQKMIKEFLKQFKNSIPPMLCYY